MKGKKSISVCTERTPFGLVKNCTSGTINKWGDVLHLNCQINNTRDQGETEFCPHIKGRKMDDVNSDLHRRRRPQNQEEGGEP